MQELEELNQVHLQTFIFFWNMITRCFTGVDVVVGIDELPAAVPARDVKRPHNRTNGINSEHFLHRRHDQGIYLRSNIIKNSY